MNDSEPFYTVRGYQLLDKKNNAMTPAMEDYLEMIYRNIESNGFMRISALAELLNVKPSSSTKMVEKLDKIGYVIYEKPGIILLSTKGKTLGKYLLARHNIIEQFLNKICKSERNFVETELIEHHLSKETVISMKIFNDFIKSNPTISDNFKKYKIEYKKSN